MGKKTIWPHVILAGQFSGQNGQNFMFYSIPLSLLDYNLIKFSDSGQICAINRAPIIYLHRTRINSPIFTLPQSGRQEEQQAAAVPLGGLCDRRSERANSDYLLVQQQQQATREGNTPVCSCVSSN